MTENEVKQEYLSENNSKLVEPILSSVISPSQKTNDDKTVPKTINKEKVVTDKQNVKKKDLSKRCNFDGCRKKMGLMPFDCKCGFKFCTKHRHDFSHNCTYDHKADQLKKLKGDMVSVKPKKIHKI